MTLTHRLAIAAAGAALGLIGVFAYVASTPVPTSWLDLVVVQVIFAGLYLATIRVLHHRRIEGA